MRNCTKHTNAMPTAAVRDQWQMRIILFCTVLSLAGCGASTAPLLQTHTLIIRCDSRFNDGQRLPMDLVFVPVDEKVAAITAIGADEWFDSDERDQWAFKQSISLRGGKKQTIRIVLERPSQAASMVIIADYKTLKKAKGQMVVLSSDSLEEENIYVTANGLLH